MKSREKMKNSENIEKHNGATESTKIEISATSKILQIIRSNARKLGIICSILLILAIVLIVVGVVVPKSISKQFIFPIICSNVA